MKQTHESTIVSLMSVLRDYHTYGLGCTLMVPSF